jgi:hypothetical protein
MHQLPTQLTERHTQVLIATHTHIHQGGGGERRKVNIIHSVHDKHSQDKLSLFVVHVYKQTYLPELRAVLHSSWSLAELAMNQ